MAKSQTDATSVIMQALTEVRTHSGDKLYKCNECDYASSQSGTLMRHLKTHSGEKSKKCNQCDYASSRADVLRTHLKTHSGEKPKQMQTM